jgi:hypothetical protein
MLTFGEVSGYMKRPGGTDFNGVIAGLYDALRGASTLGQVSEYGCMLLGSERAMRIFQRFQKHTDPIAIAMAVCCPKKLAILMVANFYEPDM